jgi:hypothetical protein
MTTTPYSDAWLERTWARMQALDVGALELDVATGLLGTWHASFLDGEPVTLELASPVDEWLAKLEDAAEAKAVEDGPAEAVVQLRNGRVHHVRRVDVKLDALTDCDVVLHGVPR